MNVGLRRDRIVPISDHVDRRVTAPLALQCLIDVNREDVFAEIQAAEQQGERIIFSCDFEGLKNLSEFSAATDGDQALLLHWSQALRWVQAFGGFESLAEKLSLIFIAFDQAVDAATVRRLQSARVRWVIVPRPDFPFADWVPSVLLDRHIGEVFLYVPDGHQVDGPFMTEDELRLQIEELTYRHPIIKIWPVPGDWHARWPLSRRLQSGTEPVGDAALSAAEFDLSVVIPFRYQTDAIDSLSTLTGCLRSLRNHLQPLADWRTEVIVAIDCDAAGDEGAAELAQYIRSELGDVADVQTPLLPRPLGDRAWRAASVRNAGFLLTRTRGDGAVIFLDADVAIESDDTFVALACPDENEILCASLQAERLTFESASSRVLSTTSALFTELGGFCEAFASYGCEDNHFIWKAQTGMSTNSSRPIALTPIALTQIRHLRAPQAADDLPIKMRRLSEAARLFYRLSLDPRVHRHFFACMGSSVLARGLLRRVFRWHPGRIIGAPLVFAMTLIESDHRLLFVRGLGEAAVWKVKAPALVLLGQWWKLRRPIDWIKLNRWRLKRPWHGLRQHSWKIRRPYDWLRLHAWRVRLPWDWLKLRIWYARRPWDWLRANAWRTQQPVVRAVSKLWLLKRPWHWLKQRLWLLPYHLIQRPSLALRNVWLRARAARFGWNAVGWRLAVGSTRLLGRAQAMQGQLHRQAVIAREAGRQTRRELAWRLPVFWQRLRTGAVEVYHRTLRQPLLALRSNLWRIPHALQAPRRLWQNHAWKIRVRWQQMRANTPRLRLAPLYAQSFGALVHSCRHRWRLHYWRPKVWWQRFRGEFWGFREPGAWLQQRAPLVFIWIWRPAMKLRYFLTYHFYWRWVRRSSGPQNEAS